MMFCYFFYVYEVVFVDCCWYTGVCSLSFIVMMLMIVDDVDDFFLCYCDMCM